MCGHQRERRLSETEAHEDIERLERAAAGVGLPPFQELSHIEDVKALEQLLEDAGIYTQPLPSDELGVGRDHLEQLRTRGMEKESREVHLHELAIESVRRLFADRFGIVLPQFPTERVLLLQEDAYDAMERHAAHPFVRVPQPGMTGGRYDSTNVIAFIRYRGHDEHAKRLQVIAHEIVHWALHATQSNWGSGNLGAFRALLLEGITEQIALEATTPLLGSPELRESARRWLMLNGKKPPEHPEAVTPTLERIANRNADALPYTTRYAYPLERYLIEDIACTIRDHDPSCKDILKLFFDAVTNRNVEPLKQLIRDIYGADAVHGLLFNVVLDDVGKPLEVAAKLHRLRMNRGSVSSTEQSVG